MYPGAYAAKSVQVRPDGRITAYVPQLFGDTIIVIGSFTGSTPPGGTMGWVVFQSGDPEFPVWISGTATTQAELAALQSELAALQSEVGSVQEDTASLQDLAANTQKICVVSRTINLTVPNATYTAVTYGIEELNDLGWHPGVTSGEITPDIPGWYLVNSWVQFGGIGSACRVIHKLNKNSLGGDGTSSGGLGMDLNLSTISNTNPDLNFSGHIYCDGTDTLSTVVWQGSGSAGSVADAKFSVQLVRPD